MQSYGSNSFKYKSTLVTLFFLSTLVLLDLKGSKHLYQINWKWNCKNLFYSACNFFFFFPLFGRICWGNWQKICIHSLRVSTRVANKKEETTKGRFQIFTAIKLLNCYTRWHWCMWFEKKNVLQILKKILTVLTRIINILMV